ncbi:MAG: lysostaphin resistance A-like protein [Micrococcaceae bacterium]
MSTPHPNPPEYGAPATPPAHQLNHTGSTVPAVPAGWPPVSGRGGPARQGTPWAPDVRPGRFLWRDLITVLAYIGLFMIGLGSLLIAIPGAMGAAAWLTGTEPTTPTQLVTDPAAPSSSAALFAINLVNYSLLAALALLASWGHLVDSLATFRRLWGLKLLLIPGLWMASITLTFFIVVALGEPVTSENQAALEGMTTVVPLWLMLLVTVVLGPFVEEYLFRHLLVGKLSRYLTVWVTAPLSVLIFGGIHFLGAGDFSLIAAVPYLVLGAVITGTYVAFRFSLAYAYALHLFNNLVSVLILYIVSPFLEQYEDMLPDGTLPGVVSALRLMIGV